MQSRTEQFNWYFVLALVVSLELWRVLLKLVLALLFVIVLVGCTHKRVTVPQGVMWIEPIKPKPEPLPPTVNTVCDESPTAGDGELFRCTDASL